MAESPITQKQDSVEDSSFDEWTIIEKKESKVNDLSKKSDEVLNTEEKCDSKETNKTKIVYIEEIDSATEALVIREPNEVVDKEVESDGVSVISEESEIEHYVFEEGRVQMIESPVEMKQPTEKTPLASQHPVDVSIPSNTLLTCSAVILIFSIMTVLQINFKEYKPNDNLNTETETRFKRLNEIEERFKTLNSALDQIHRNMPEIEEFKNHLAYKIYENDKSKYVVENCKNLKNLNLENILNHSMHNDKLTILETYYQKFCSAMNKVDSSGSIVESELCKTPKILADMIVFKQNLQQAFEKTADTISSEKRIFIDVDRKLNSVSETLLSEFSSLFSKFSLKMQTRLKKFGHKINKRLCSLNNNPETHDKFITILLENKHSLSNCNETLNSIVMDFKLNSSDKEETHDKIRKRSYAEFKKNNFKHDYKSDKEYKGAENLIENDYYGQNYNENIVTPKIKGEIKNDNNWRKNKYDNQEQYNYKDKKYSKQEKVDKYTSEQKNKDYNLNNSYENNKDQDFNYKLREKNENNESNNKKNKKNDKNKFEDSRKVYDYKYEHNNDIDKKFEYQETDRYDDYKSKNVNKRDRSMDYKYESQKKNVNYNQKFEINKNFNEKSAYKNSKENTVRLDKFKEDKYTKYHGNEDRNDKYSPTGEWQLQRGKAREKLRKSDWYFVRADSRQSARSHARESNKGSRPSRPSSSSRRDQDDHTSGKSKKERFSRRLVSKIGRTWDFLNKKFKKYF